jgi:hypothetical protein
MTTLVAVITIVFFSNPNDKRVFKNVNSSYSSPEMCAAEQQNYATVAKRTPEVLSATDRKIEISFVCVPTSYLPAYMEGYPELN